MTETIPPHWHYATGLIGYGADGSNGTFPSVTNVFDLVAELTDDLQDREEFLQEAMDVCAENDDAGELLKEYRRLKGVQDALVQLECFPRQRKMAFWADKQDRLERKIQAYILGTFPLVVWHNSHLEVWLCLAGQACEHWREEQ